MTVIYPTAKVTSRWNGALEARLRHAPLENFLRARGRRWVLTGDARVTDNLASAAIYFVDSALAEIADGTKGGAVADQQAAVGLVACAVSHGLAGVIREPYAWRIAALVGTARLLAPRLGLDAAARVAAGTAREYNAGLTGGADLGLLRVSVAAASAVESNDETLVATAVTMIAQRLWPELAECEPLRATPLSMR